MNNRIDLKYVKDYQQSILAFTIRGTELKKAKNIVENKNAIKDIIFTKLSTLIQCQTGKLMNKVLHATK